MPRYYFHFINGGDKVIDHSGRDFANDGGARQEALLTARDAVTGIRLGLRHFGGWILVVQDESGREICSITIPRTA